MTAGYSVPSASEGSQKDHSLYLLWPVVNRRGRRGHRADKADVWKPEPVSAMPMKYANGNRYLRTLGLLLDEKISILHDSTHSYVESIPSIFAFYICLLHMLLPNRNFHAAK